jgi:hypothetical protein
VDFIGEPRPSSGRGRPLGHSRHTKFSSEQPGKGDRIGRVIGSRDVGTGGFDSTSRTLVSDQNADADYYYWRALNPRNVPKQSIAQAFADYFGITVYGAGSGSHIEVQRGNEWITSNKFKKETGRWPGAPQTLRLHPDRGTYNPFKPTT